MSRRKAITVDLFEIGARVKYVKTDINDRITSTKEGIIQSKVGNSLDIQWNGSATTEKWSGTTRGLSLLEPPLEVSLVEPQISKLAASNKKSASTNESGSLEKEDGHPFKKVKPNDQEETLSVGDIILFNSPIFGGAVVITVIVQIESSKRPDSPVITTSSDDLLYMNSLIRKIDPLLYKRLDLNKKLGFVWQQYQHLMKDANNKPLGTNARVSSFTLVPGKVDVVSFDEYGRLWKAWKAKNGDDDEEEEELDTDEIWNAHFRKKHHSSASQSHGAKHIVEDASVKDKVVASKDKVKNKIATDNGKAKPIPAASKGKAKSNAAATSETVMAVPADIDCGNIFLPTLSIPTLSTSKKDVDNNYINGDNIDISGDNSEKDGDNNDINGNNNEKDGDNNDINGNNIDINGNNSEKDGDNNDTSGNNIDINGNNNEKDGDNNDTNGNNNEKDVSNNDINGDNNEKDVSNKNIVNDSKQSLPPLSEIFIANKNFAVTSDNHKRSFSGANEEINISKQFVENLARSITCADLKKQFLMTSISGDTDMTSDTRTTYSSTYFPSGGDGGKTGCLFISYNDDLFWLLEVDTTLYKRLFNENIATIPKAALDTTSATEKVEIALYEMLKSPSTGTVSVSKVVKFLPDVRLLTSSAPLQRLSASDNRYLFMDKLSKDKRIVNGIEGTDNMLIRGTYLLDAYATESIIQGGGFAKI